MGDSATASGGIARFQLSMLDRLELLPNALYHGVEIAFGMSHARDMAAKLLMSPKKLRPLVTVIWWWGDR